MMSNSNGFSPDWVSAPGETIRDILAERGISSADFARSIGQSASEVERLLSGASPITIGVARALEGTLGGSRTFWMARDFEFRRSVLSPEEKAWLHELPIGDMIRFSWLRPVPRPGSELFACLKFFGVPDLKAWQALYADVKRVVAFKASPSYESHSAAVAAWLRQGEIESKGIPCRAWSPTTFRGALGQIRLLTRQPDPQEFLPQLRTLCGDAGVAVVIVRAPSGCRISGATTFLSPQKALLMLSFRFLSDDQFWFTFFHEAGHLLSHGQRLFLEGTGAPSTQEESEADEFAADVLIPKEHRMEFQNLPVNGRTVMRFAKRMNIAPGIVVGQLQHSGKFTYRQLNNLKRRYNWVAA